MLTVKDLEEFENYMRSGELETDFKDGCENDRYYLLELLEKFMDVAELADETATKVIFRGQIGPQIPVSQRPGPYGPLRLLPAHEMGPLPLRPFPHASFRKGPACHRQTGPLSSSGYVFARTPLPYASMPGRDSTSCMAAQRRSTSSRGLT